MQASHRRLLYVRRAAVDRGLIQQVAPDRTDATRAALEAAPPAYTAAVAAEKGEGNKEEEEEENVHETEPEDTRPRATLPAWAR